MIRKYFIKFDKDNEDNNKKSPKITLEAFTQLIKDKLKKFG